MDSDLPRVANENGPTQNKGPMRVVHSNGDVTSEIALGNVDSKASDDGRRPPSSEVQGGLGAAMLPSAWSRGQRTPGSILV